MWLMVETQTPLNNRKCKQSLNKSLCFWWYSKWLYICIPSKIVAADIFLDTTSNDPCIWASISTSFVSTSLFSFAEIFEYGSWSIMTLILPHSTTTASHHNSMHLRRIFVWWSRLKCLSTIESASWGKFSLKRGYSPRNHSNWHFQI